MRFYQEVIKVLNRRSPDDPHLRDTKRGAPDVIFRTFYFFAFIAFFHDDNIPPALPSKNGRTSRKAAIHHKFNIRNFTNVPRALGAIRFRQRYKSVR